MVANFGIGTLGRVRHIHPFVWGHILGALVVGAIAGAFFDLEAVVVFPAVLAGGAIVGTLVVWWWPKLDAASWKVWLVATFANPLMPAALIWMVIQRECLVAGTEGWDCLFADVGPFVAALCLPAPLIGLAVRRLMAKRQSPSTAGF
jgi:hypothetical protein